MVMTSLASLWCVDLIFDVCFFFHFETKKGAKREKIYFNTIFQQTDEKNNDS